MRHLMPLIESFYASPNCRGDELFTREKVSSPQGDLIFRKQHKINI